MPLTLTISQAITSLLSIQQTRLCLKKDVVVAEILKKDVVVAEMSQQSYHSKIKLKDMKKVNSTKKYSLCEAKNIKTFAVKLSLKHLLSVTQKHEATLFELLGNKQRFCF